MRIQPTEKSLSPDPAAPAQPGSAASQSVPQRTDRVELSALSQGAGGLAPERLQELQYSLESDTYSVKSGDVSRRIVDFYLIQGE